MSLSPEKNTETSKSFGKNTFSPNQGQFIMKCISDDLQKKRKFVNAKEYKKQIITYANEYFDKHSKDAKKVTDLPKSTFSDQLKKYGIPNSHMYKRLLKENSEPKPISKVKKVQRRKNADKNSDSTDLSDDSEDYEVKKNALTTDQALQSTMTSSNSLEKDQEYGTFQRSSDTEIFYSDEVSVLIPCTQETQSNPMTEDSPISTALQQAYGPLDQAPLKTFQGSQNLNTGHMNFSSMNQQERESHLKISSADKVSEKPGEAIPWYESYGCVNWEPNPEDLNLVDIPISCKSYQVGVGRDSFYQEFDGVEEAKLLKDLSFLFSREEIWSECFKNWQFE